MKIIERILIIIAVTGVAFKFLHWPGAGLMIVFGLSLLAILYFALGWLLFRPKKSKAIIAGLAIPGGLALTISLTGIMFKLQHWPGGSIHLITGAFLCLIAIVPLSLWFMKKHRDHTEEYIMQERKSNALDAPERPIAVERSRYHYSRNVLKRAVIIGAIAAGFYFLPWSVYNRIQYWDDPEYARLMTRWIENPENLEYRQDLENYRARKFGYEPYNYKEGDPGENR